MKTLLGLRDLGYGVAVFIEREAGHDVISLGLILLGVWVADAANRAQFARDLVMYGLGVLSRGMGQSLRTAPSGAVQP